MSDEPVTWKRLAELVEKCAWFQRVPVRGSLHHEVEVVTFDRQKFADLLRLEAGDHDPEPTP